MYCVFILVLLFTSIIKQCVKKRQQDRDRHVDSGKTYICTYVYITHVVRSTHSHNVLWISFYLTSKKSQRATVILNTSYHSMWKPIKLFYKCQFGKKRKEEILHERNIIFPLVHVSEYSRMHHCIIDTSRESEDRIHHCLLLLSSAKLFFRQQTCWYDSGTHSHSQNIRKENCGKALPTLPAVFTIYVTKHICI